MTFFHLVQPRNIHQFPTFGMGKHKAPQKSPQEAPAPGLYKTMAEGNLAWLSLVSIPAGFRYFNQLPNGDGHPVLLIPGFGTSEKAMSIMAGILKKKGYQPKKPHLNGKNVGSNPNSHLDKLEARLKEVYEQNGRRKVSLVGWSLGGMQSRELAKLHPEMVRQVITLGSPFGAVKKNGGVLKMLQKVGEYIGKQDPFALEDPMIQRADQYHVAPPVPSTAVYSKNDGVADWNVDIQDEKGDDAPAENVRVHTSHMGMANDWTVIYTVLDRLSQPEGAWKPFDRKTVPAEVRWLFPESAPVR